MAYKTGYKDALKRNKITYDDLMPKNKLAYDEVVNVENELKEIVLSLADADLADKTAINQDIARIEETLAILDKAVITKIDGNKALVEKVAKMQEGRKKSADNRANANASTPLVTDTAKEENKQQSTTQTATTTETTPLEEKKEEQQQATPPVVATPPATPVVEEKKKPKRNWFGLFASAVVLTALAGYGINAHKTGKWPFKK